MEDELTHRIPREHSGSKITILVANLFLSRSKKVRKNGKTDLFKCPLSLKGKEKLIMRTDNH